MMLEEGKPIKVYGRHCWHYFIEDYFRLWDNPEFPFVSRIQVKHTLKTRQTKALKLPLGFWCKKPVKLTRQKVCKLLKADQKRIRSTYDSYTLFEERKSVSSEPHLMDKILFNPKFDYPPKSHEKFPRVRANKYYTKSGGLKWMTTNWIERREAFEERERIKRVINSFVVNRQKEFLRNMRYQTTSST
jgi:hypothetical protein